jgi:hypothetical protein
MFSTDEDSGKGDWEGGDGEKGRWGEYQKKSFPYNPLSENKLLLPPGIIE